MRLHILVGVEFFDRRYNQMKENIELDFETIAYISENIALLQV